MLIRKALQQFFFCSKCFKYFFSVYIVKISFIKIKTHTPHTPCQATPGATIRRYTDPLLIVWADGAEALN